jgi:hypothetical protein
MMLPRARKLVGEYEDNALMEKLFKPVAEWMLIDCESV